VGRLILDLVPVATAPGTIEAPDQETTEKGGGEWVVTVFDNDHNTVEEVIMILMIATGCTLDEAELETWEVHHLGSSVVHHGTQEVCERVAATIREIGIKVEVTQE
jgi:ATP-dependent Clp protease adapter protein ClpS